MAILATPTQKSPFNLCEFVSTYKKSGYFILLFLKYRWLKNLPFWLTENILTHITETKIFPNLEFVQEHSKEYKFSLSNKFSEYYWPNHPKNSKSSVFGSFWVHFPYFRGKRKFSRKSSSVTHNFIWVSSIVPKFRKK